MRTKCVLCDVTEKIIDFTKLKMTLIAKKKDTFEMFIIVRPRISVLYIYGKFENEYDNFQNIRRMENGGARYYI